MVRRSYQLKSETLVFMQNNHVAILRLPLYSQIKGITPIIHLDGSAIVLSLITLQPVGNYSEKESHYFINFSEGNEITTQYDKFELIAVIPDKLLGTQYIFYLGGNQP